MLSVRGRQPRALLAPSCTCIASVHPSTIPNPPFTASYSRRKCAFFPRFERRIARSFAVRRNVSEKRKSYTRPRRERERVLRSSFSHHSHQCLLERGAENIAANSVSCLFQYKTYEETRRVLLYRGSYFKAFISLSCSVQWSMSYSISTGHGKERGQQCRRYLRVTR